MSKACRSETLKIIVSKVTQTVPAATTNITNHTQDLKLTFLVLDLGLDVLDGVAWLNLEGDGLTRQCLDEDLHLV
jgi:hypothetical protein